MALGANTGRVVRLIVGRIALFVGVGLAVALVALLAGRGLTANLVYKTVAADPVIVQPRCFWLRLGPTQRPLKQSAAVRFLSVSGWRQAPISA